MINKHYTAAYLTAALLFVLTISGSAVFAAENEPEAATVYDEETTYAMPETADDTSVDTAGDPSSQTDTESTEEDQASSAKPVSPQKKELSASGDSKNDSADDNNDDPEEEDPEDEPEQQNGWVTENGKKYYYIDGVKVTGMRKIGKAWYFFKANGVMKTGWLKIKNKKYYFDLKTGRRYKGRKVIKKGVYYFRPNGTMVRGWFKNGKKTFYHDPKSGKRMFGLRRIGKYTYYFGKNGLMFKGWLKQGGKKYYFDGKGHKCFGKIKVKGKKYYLSKATGARVSKSTYKLYDNVWGETSKTSYIIYVSKRKRKVNVFKKKDGIWKLSKRFSCSIGAAGTPTPEGRFKMTCKVYHFGENKGYTCWYASGFIGSSYLMHSVVCYRGTKIASDGRLGMAISHGCIRMAMSSAKWIYYKVPCGTRVIIH